MRHLTRHSTSLYKDLLFHLKTQSDNHFAFREEKLFLSLPPCPSLEINKELGPSLHSVLFFRKNQYILIQDNDYFNENLTKALISVCKELQKDND